MKKVAIIFLSILLLIIAISIYIFVDINRQSDTNIAVTNFSDCAKLKSSTVTADYPNSKCVTNSGEIFNETPVDFTSNESTKSGTGSAQ